MTITARERSIWFVIYLAAVNYDAVRSARATTLQLTVDGPLEIACLHIKNLRRVAAGLRPLVSGHHDHYNADMSNGAMTMKQWEGIRLNPRS